MSDPPDDDLRAAEYVLGTLEPGETERFRAELRHNPALARAVTAWEVRLVPLAATLPAVPPPADLWARIEAGLPPRPASAPLLVVGENRPASAVDHRRGRVLQSLGFWRATTAGALTLAASLAGLLL